METVICDTETTGLSADDEIVEIALIDGEGSVLLNTLVKPTRLTSWPQAQRIHGISPEMVQHFPTIDFYHDVISEIVSGKHLIIYNSAYDMQYLKFAEEKPAKISCAMKSYLNYSGGRRWKKLDYVVDQIGYEFEGEAHRALADARAALAVWKFLVEKGVV